MWKPVRTKYGVLSYEVNELGDVRNSNTKRLSRKLSDSDDGYIYYSLVIDTRTGKTKSFKAHRLVCEAFKPVRFKGQIYVNHIDGNKQNNHIDNLEWITPKENTLHAIKMGLNNPYHKYDEITIHDICKELSKGKRSLRQIAFLYKVNTNIVFQIYHRTIWKRISKDYEFADYSKNLLDNYYNDIDRLLLEGKSTLEISKNNFTDLPYIQFQNLIFNRKHYLKNKGLL